VSDIAQCDVDPDLFFDTKPTAVAEAIAACHRCARLVKCLEDIMRMEAGVGVQDRHGVCGGLTAAERLALDRKRRAEAKEAAEAEGVKAS
jgi:hypothetical protein